MSISMLEPHSSSIREDAIPEGPCRIEGCENLCRVSNGLCRPCHRKGVDRPKWRPKRIPEGPCRNEGCERPAGHSEGLCQACRRAELRRARAEAAKENGWKGDSGSPALLHGICRNVGDAWVSPKDGYVSIKTGSGSRPQALHRLVMEVRLGRDLQPGETVHHINGDRADNHPANLELWSKSQPAGQRVADKVEWAREIEEKYGSLYDAGMLHFLGGYEGSGGTLIQHGTRDAVENKGCRCGECVAAYAERVARKRAAEQRERDRKRAETLATGTHGTGRMVQAGCVCPTCKEFAAIDTLLERQRFAATQRLKSGEMAHGTNAAYSLARCRCGLCWEWYRKNQYQAAEPRGPRI